MAKFIKRTSGIKWNFFSSNNSSFLEILNDKIDCLAAEITQEVEVNDQLLQECCSNFQTLKTNLQQTKNIILQRAGYFEKSQVEELVSKSGTEYLRIYNGIYENEHFIFIAAINSNFEVSSDVNILCTRIPPCPPPPTGKNPSIPNEEIQDTYFKI